MSMAPPDRPFNKWDTASTTQEPHSTGQRQEHQIPQRPTGSLRVKMWLLRFAWITSTGMLVVGALLMILILADQGHLIGL